jgi:hypothetical protein
MDESNYDHRKDNDKYRALECYKLIEQQRYIMNYTEAKHKVPNVKALLDQFLALLAGFEAHDWQKVSRSIGKVHNMIVKSDFLAFQVERFLDQTPCLTFLAQCAIDRDCPVFMKALAVLGRLAYCSSLVVRVMDERDLISGVIVLFLSTEWHPSVGFLFMRLFMSIASDGPERRRAILETPIFDFCLHAIAESDTAPLVLAALQFIVGFFRVPMMHVGLRPAAPPDDGRRSALCEAVGPCFQRHRTGDYHDDRRMIGAVLFQCITNLEFWEEHFETPLRAGLHLFFMASFMADPEPLIQMAEWLENLWVFERNCFVRGAPEFIEGMIGEIPVIDLACLVLDDEGAPPPLRAIHARLAENRLLHDRMRGHICAILTRLMVGSEEVLAELNSRHFFAGLLVAIEDRASAFKFDAMFMLSVAFQKLADPELGDFMTSGFVDLLESIELPLNLSDGRDLTAELVAVAYRLNELLTDDDDLKRLLYETIPDGLRSVFEDLGAPR